MKKDILPFVTWMGLESIMLSEISQVELDEHHRISLICVIQKQKQTKKDIDTKKRQAVSRGGRQGISEMSEGDQKVQISGYKINKLWEYNIQYGDYS